MRILYYHFPNLKMIDRFCYMIFGGLDRMCEAVAKFMEPKPKKKNERHKSNRKISARTIQKS